MCEPTTLLLGSLALTGASGLYQASAARAAGRYE